MYRKILSLLLCVLLFSLAGCRSSKEVNNESSEPIPSEPEVVYYTNPLTGIENLEDESIAKRRPVAIMVNNISVAQKVQTGLSKADVVYETEVEGGITRLMAVFQDITAAEKIGTVRSARYAYVDLAMGHKAVYVHHGQDETYCRPHLKDTQTFALGTNNAGVRVKNGLSYEHTLYGYGEKLWKNLIKRGFDLKLKNPDNWQNFADAETSVTYENVANTVNVPFSYGYKTVFKYDAESGKYVRYFNDTKRTDYYTGDPVKFKNVFVLLTSITDYPDGKHRKVALEGGKGYYCVNGTYTPIKWSKGSASSKIVFTNEDGTPLTVNQGNSWVCLKSKVFKATFE